MKRVLSEPSFYLPIAIVIFLIVLTFSSVPELWGISIIAFVVALAALGWHQAPPVLVWMIAFNMLSIWADIARIELNSAGWAYSIVEYNQPDAIIQSSCAITFLAIGMRCGLGIGRTIFQRNLDIIPDEDANIALYSAPRITLAYVAFQPVAALVATIGYANPGLMQPAHVFGFLKFALIYMLAAKVFATGRNGLLLVGVIAMEIVTGSIGGWASYKEGFFVVLIALASTSRRFKLKHVVLAIAGTGVILYISLAWTAVKQEYRTNLAGSDASTSLSWLADKYFGGEIDFGNATVHLLERVGYTKLYAMVMDADTDGVRGIYPRALLHIVTPRIFFPDKAILDDSAQTASALHVSIADDTSIGLGYVAQAYIDFGFPDMLVPIAMLGTVVGTIYVYFVTRRAPPPLREAFAIACLFNSLAFEANIDKQLGELIISLLVLGFALRYGGAALSLWIENDRQASGR